VLEAETVDSREKDNVDRTLAFTQSKKVERRRPTAHRGDGVRRRILGAETLAVVLDRSQVRMPPGRVARSNLQDG